MFRIRTIVLCAAALPFVATCSSPQAPDPGPARVQAAVDLAAVALGVAIDASDDRAAPRLVRAVVPRPARAGTTPDDAARDHLAALAPLWIPHRRASDLVPHGTQRLRDGGSIVRLRQQVGGVDLHHGELRVMLHADNSLAAVSGTMRAAAGSASFQSTPAAALEHALDELYGSARARPAITAGADRAGYRELTVADTPELRVQTARARRELLPDGDQLVAIWAVELFADRPGADGVMESVAHRYLIDDADGSVLRNVDLAASDAFTYRVFAETTGISNPLDGALDSFNPHPTGTPDNTLPPPAPYELVVMDGFNGPHDPWLAAGATTTSGNNVDAFADIAVPAGFGPGDIRPDVRPGRLLDHRFDFTAEPLANQTQSKAAAVNVFFVTNWLHDWYYDSGFTEITGNAQVDNYGRGGVAGDPLIAHAQANALGGSRDNANMATPDDGLSPVMNMFLWSGRGTTTLTTPAGTPSSAAFRSGPRFFTLTGTVALVQDRIGGTHKACSRINTNVTGRIALVEFDGTCATTTIFANVERAGAIGIIAMIATPGAAAQVLAGNGNSNLAGAVIGFDDGRALEAALPVSVTIRRTTSLEHDGDFDNAIIAHEWGHYLHHRLAVCEAKLCGAMSEGWGDFTALHMMLRPTDNPHGTFGMSLYSLAAGGLVSGGFGDPGYFGIRRFPYSVTPTKGLGFRHIGDGAALPDQPVNPGPARNPNSEVHNAGEVWASMVWDAYVALLDHHGYDEARRRMSDYVVAGLLLTPPDATFTEARDAILAAVGALDTDDMLRMAAAFAARGAGTCAVSPGGASTDFTGVVESRVVAAKLATSALRFSDDGVSCDHDGYLDPGETGTLHITLANHGVVPAEGVVVTPSTATTGVLVGPKLSVGSIAARSQVELAIPVQLPQSGPVGTTLDLAVRIEADAGCDTGRLVVEAHVPIGVDEEAAIATTDTAETGLVAWTPTGDSAAALWGRTGDPIGNHVLFGSEAVFASDTQLMSPVLQVSATEPLVVTLQHAYNLSATQFPGVFLNGGVIEVSSDAGATWRDVTEVGVDPGYPGVISSDFSSTLAGRRVFGGKNPLFPERETLSLDFGTQFAGQTVRLRFRLATEQCCTAFGWEIDNVTITGITNTPFPGFVAEPTKCFGATTTLASSDGDVIDVRSLPRYSLDGVPGAAGVR